MSETPRTDDAARQGAYMSAGEYPETCGKQFVHLDFARTLERELNAANARIAELEKDNKILALKSKLSLANNLCPAHRDKQSGQSCLACRIESLEKDKARLDFMDSHYLGTHFYINLSGEPSIREALDSAMKGQS